MAKQKVIDILKEGTLLPPPPNVCQECAIKHDPKITPHNPDSLYYQYWFKKNHGRWPTWKDAIAHLPEQSQEILKGVLLEHGIKI